MKKNIFFVIVIVTVATLVSYQASEASPDANSKILNRKEKREIMKASKTPNTKDAIEALRKKIPEAQTISEANGVSIPDESGVYFTLTRLEAAAKTVPCETIDDYKLLMQYLEDADLKIRFIAASALERTLKAHPNGMSMGEIDGKSADRHNKLRERFETKINEHFKQSPKT